tara:strand:- start:2180 stop:2413 length:234 start_codon:yes stop_codon:yes gene_type:complete
MEYTSETIQKAIDKKGWSGKQKTDELLRIDCAMYAHLGSDSSKGDVDEANRTSKKIYKMIKEIDEELGKTLLTAMDS